MAVTVLVIVWEWLSRSGLGAQHLLSPPSGIGLELVSDPGFFGANSRATLLEAALGYLWGNALAVAVGIATVQLRRGGPVLLRTAIAIHSLPIIAIGPILQVIFQGNGAKVALAAIVVFFPTLIALIVGLEAADESALQVIRSLGGSRWMELVLVRIPGALPNLFAGLRIAVPGAILGAIVGEFFGGDRGLGVAMVVAMSSLASDRLWGLVVVTSALSLVGYALVGWIGRRLTPWAPTT